MKSHGLEMVGSIASSDNIDAILIETGTGKVQVQDDLDVAGDTELTGDLDVIGQLTIQSGTPGVGKVLESDATGISTWSLKSVPAGEIILFEKDTVVAGYTLLATQDDDVVYITKGSAAGGETGGTAKSGSTWSRSHTHSFSGGGTHNHKLYTIISRNGYSYASNGTTLRNWSAGADSHNGICVEADDDEFATQEQWTANATATASGTTGADNMTTWRPKGRNWTRQQKL